MTKKKNIKKSNHQKLRHIWTIYRGFIKPNIETLIKKVPGSVIDYSKLNNIESKILCPVKTDLDNIVREFKFKLIRYYEQSLNKNKNMWFDIKYHITEFFKTNDWIHLTKLINIQTRYNKNFKNNVWNDISDVINNFLIIIKKVYSN